MDEITMTAQELETIRKEVGELETTGRREMAARIKTAREWGDLKENAEYHAAKEDQGHLETRIARLRERIRHATVVDVDPSSGVAQHGSTVSYTDETARSRTVTIVSPNDARPADGLLSVASPVAKALIGHRVGDAVQVQTPAGVRTLTIDSIS
jgi:transcription elongation factor GreA